MRSLAQSKHRSAHTSLYCVPVFLPSDQLVIRQSISQIESMVIGHDTSAKESMWKKHLPSACPLKEVLLSASFWVFGKLERMHQLWGLSRWTRSWRSIQVLRALLAHPKPWLIAWLMKLMLDSFLTTLPPVAAHNRFYSWDVAFTVRNINTKMPPGSPYFAGHNTDLDENSRILCENFRSISIGYNREMIGLFFRQSVPAVSGRYRSFSGHKVFGMLSTWFYHWALLSF